MNISVAIMTHFDRREHARSLKMRLDSMWFMNEAEIIYDTGLGEWDTGKRALEYGIGKGDWHIILQDDAIISESFFENLYGCLTNVPEENLVSLYLGKVKPNSLQVRMAFNRAIVKQASWISSATLLWGVGIAIPTKDIVPMLGVAAAHPRLLYDRRVGQYYLQNRKKVYYTVVSLVQHNYKLPSLTGHDTIGNPRVCHLFSEDDLIEFNSKCIVM